MKRVPLVLIALWFASAVSVPAAAQSVPQTMTFQGRLAKPDGTPVPDTNSPTLTFRLYSALSGGNLLWSQVSVNVGVHNGAFAARLDFSTGYGMGQNLNSLFSGTPYLEIQVGSDAPLTPRQPFASVPYAFLAGTVPDGSLTFSKFASGVFNFSNLGGTLNGSQITDGSIASSKLQGGGAAPLGAAGGDLTGSYPNPLLATLPTSLAKVSGGLMTASTTTGVSVDQLQETLNYFAYDYGTATAWQSFTPARSGNLVALDIDLGLLSGSTYTLPLSLYAGEGTSGTLLLTQNLTIVGYGEGNLRFQRILLTSPVSVVTGSKVTWAIGPGADANNPLSVGEQNGNPYPGGTSDVGADWDYGFRTYLAGGSLLSLSGPVGIGVTTPYDALDIQGNIGLSGDLLSTGNIYAAGKLAVAREDVLRGITLDMENTNMGSLTSGSGNALRFGVRSSGEAIASQRTAGSAQYDLEFYTGYGNRLEILNNGNVGINTSSPSYTLDVAGTAQVQGFRMPTGAASGSFLMSDGNGVGTWQALSAAINGVGWSLKGNSSTNPANNFVGTTDNQPLLFKVNGHPAMRYSYAENTTYEYRSINALGGSEINSIAAGVVGATIAGGGYDSFTTTDYPNQVTADFGTIGGGDGNAVRGFSATIAGGVNNIASGEFAAIAGGADNTTNINGNPATPGGNLATIAGGIGNTASGTSATIGGGSDNTASGEDATIAGGNTNIASGTSATIGGGFLNIASGAGAIVAGGGFNTAAGDYSFAAGQQAQANSQGSFVWNDASNTTDGNYFASTGPNQFLIHATGGVGINTNAPMPGSALDVNGNITERGSDFILKGRGGGLGNNGGAARALVDYGANGLIVNFNNDFGKTEITGPVLLNGVATAQFDLTVDNGNANNGVLSNGLHFGDGGSGEGIASKRTPTGNQHGLDFYTAFIPRLSLTNAGNVGIGTTSPTYALSVVGDANIDRNDQNAGTVTNTLHFGGVSGEAIGSNRSTNVNQYGLDFYTGGVNRMSITGGGRVGIGMTAPAYTLDVNGTIRGTNVSPSDVRYKTNIVGLNDALKDVLALRGVAYEYDHAKWPAKNFPEGKQIGFIAQELEKIFPELVGTDQEGYKSVNYIGIVPVLVESVKTLRTQLDAKQNQIDAQQKEIETLKARAAQLEAIEVRLKAIEAALKTNETTPK